MNYLEFKKQADVTGSFKPKTATPTLQAPEIKPPTSTQPTNQYTQQLNNISEQNSSVYGGVQHQGQPKAQPIDYTVSADTFKDPTSVKSFFNSMPQTVKDNTSTFGKVNAIGIKSAIKNFIKEHPVITSATPHIGPLASAASSFFDSGTLTKEDQAAVFKKFKEENPNFMPSLVAAIKKGSPDAIKELQQLASGGGGKGLFTDNEINQITSAAKTASWDAIKRDPINNLPKVAGLFLRNIGMGGTVTNFVENPIGFYGGLLALLFGVLGVSGSGNESSQPPMYNSYARIPYM